MENIKNLLVFISPNKKFTPECDLLAKIQIDNALDLGQKDMLLVTNFPYEYNSIKSTVVGDENYYSPRPRSIKTMIVPHLIDLGLIEKDEIYWNHDFDAYQLETITKKELELDVDVGFTDYGWRSRWCLGTAFFKDSSKEVFQWIRDYILSTTEEDETALLALTTNNTYDINSRIKKLNITYQLGMRHIEENYRRAIKSIKILHFHPYYKDYNLLDKFMYGKTKLGFPLMNERLVKIFHSHGVK